MKVNLDTQVNRDVDLNLGSLDTLDILVHLVHLANLIAIIFLGNLDAPVHPAYLEDLLSLAHPATHLGALDSLRGLVNLGNPAKNICHQMALHRALRALAVDHSSLHLDQLINLDHNLVLDLHRGRHKGHQTIHLLSIMKLVHLGQDQDRNHNPDDLALNPRIPFQVLEKTLVLSALMVTTTTNPILLSLFKKEHLECTHTK